MAKVRRLNVSQIEGGYSDDSDKRPNGEIALYDDDNGSFDLVIHDGVNSTSLNKVLGKGKLYGHGADSGDGNGLDTIKLIPDITLQQQGSDQYLIIDPTAPNHIHIRPGGNIDNSSANLFVGGENTHVLVSDGGNSVSITTTLPGDPATVNVWTFDNSGNITFPDSSVQTTAFTGSTNADTVDVTDTNGLTTTYYPTFVESRAGTQILRADQNLTYKTDDNILGVGAIGFSGGNLRIVSVPANSYGAAGDKQGDLAFNTTHFYRCYYDYSATPITVSWSNVLEYQVGTHYIQADITDPTLLNGNLSITLISVNGAPQTTEHVTSYELVSGSTYKFFLANSEPWQSFQSSQLQVSQLDIWKRIAWSGDTW